MSEKPQNREEFSRCLSVIMRLLQRPKRLPQMLLWERCFWQPSWWIFSGRFFCSLAWSMSGSIRAILFSPRSIRPLDRIGSYGLWGLIAFLVLVWISNLLGPPPPSETVVAVSALVGLWLVVLWGYWVDRHRQVR